MPASSTNFKIQREAVGASKKLPCSFSSFRPAKQGILGSNCIEMHGRYYVQIELEGNNIPSGYKVIPKPKLS